MANLKIIWTTGRPFSPVSIDKIGYQISSGEFNIYSGSYWANQSSSMDRGYRPATAEEIAEHWNVLHSRWTPEPGDRVIITQNIGNWCNTRGTIVGDGGDDYWVVRRDDDGHTCNFKREDQMILAPYEETAKPVETSKSLESRHGFTIGDIVIPDCDSFKGRQCIVKDFGSASVGVHCPSGAGLGGHTLAGKCPDHTGLWYLPLHLKLASKEEPETVSKPSTPTIPIPKEGYTTVRVFTEEEFKSKDLWDTFGSRGCPRGWNTDGYMNEYLGRYLQISNRDFKYDNTDFKYASWTFKDTDFEVIHESVKSEPEPKVEAKLEPKEPEMKPQRFKVGDRVTYKSRSECYGGGYHYGGNNQYGYVGTIKEYLKYKPDNNCYKITVTCKEGEYSMLESEFYEYDDLGLGVNIHKSTSGSIGIGTSSGTDFRVTSSGTANAIYLPLDTWGIHFHKTSSELKEEDALAKYDQAPVTLRKKPKRKLIIVNTY
jgi:hypothetical protein